MKNNVIYVDFSKPSRITPKKKSTKTLKLNFLSKIKTLLSLKLKKLRVASKQKSSPRIRINK